MRWDCVCEGEGLNELSARLGVPGCMLLRANRIYSAAWLLPGREIVVPDLQFCLRDWGICPRRALHMSASYKRNERDVNENHV